MEQLLSFITEATIRKDRRDELLGTILYLDAPVTVDQGSELALVRTSCELVGQRAIRSRQSAREPTFWVVKRTSPIASRLNRRAGVQQRRRVPDSDEGRRRPRQAFDRQRENAIDQTALSLCPRRTASLAARREIPEPYRPVPASRRPTWRPSGVNATEATAIWCPRKLTHFASRREVPDPAISGQGLAIGANTTHMIRSLVGSPEHGCFASGGDVPEPNSPVISTRSNQAPVWARTPLS